MKQVKRTLVLLSAALSLYAAQAASHQATPGSTATAPTNSKLNRRDANGDNPTAQSQPNDKADIQLAARVRHAIVSDGSLSTTAHNVKLVAAGGVVTLRGVVRNADEKARVEDIATRTSGVSRVDNQLDVEH